MAPSRKTMTDHAAGEIMLNEVFKVVEQLNATAGPIIAKKGERSGNITFNPKIIIHEDGHKQYSCFVEIYTPTSRETTEMNMEWDSTTVEQFRQALPTIFTALSGLAKEGYVSDMYTVGLVSPNGEETEVYTPDVLKPGMYSITEQEDEH